MIAAGLVAVDAAQDGVPAPLPHATRLPHRPLARRPLGALRMGLEHGAWCLGCCWFLMALLFFGGVMNLYWIVGLAVFVLLEKTIPLGHWLGRVAGVVLVGCGVVLLAQARALAF